MLSQRERLRRQERKKRVGHKTQQLQGTETVSFLIISHTHAVIDSPGVVVRVVVVVEEAGGAVETERGGWEVGETAENGEGEGMAAVKKRQPIRAHTDYHKITHSQR